MKSPYHIDPKPAEYAMRDADSAGTHILIEKINGIDHGATGQLSAQLSQPTTEAPRSTAPAWHPVTGFHVQS